MKPTAGLRPRTEYEDGPLVSRWVVAVRQVNWDSRVGASTLKVIHKELHAQGIRILRIKKVTAGLRRAVEGISYGSLRTSPSETPLYFWGDEVTTGGTVHLPDCFIACIERNEYSLLHGRSMHGGEQIRFYYVHNGESWMLILPS